MRIDRIQDLRPRMTDEFLATLVELARVTGWENDHVEVHAFVSGAFELVDKTPPNLEPYEDEE